MMWDIADVPFAPSIPYSGDNRHIHMAAHPHLSKPDELPISYNVNTLNSRDHFNYADIYRPRFINIIVR